VEWGKGLTEGIADNWLEITIERDSLAQSENRSVKIVGFGERWAGIDL